MLKPSQLQGMIPPCKPGHYLAQSFTFFVLIVRITSYLLWSDFFFSRHTSCLHIPSDRYLLIHSKSHFTSILSFSFPVWSYMEFICFFLHIQHCQPSRSFILKICIWSRLLYCVEDLNASPLCWWNLSMILQYTQPQWILKKGFDWFIFAQHCKHTQCKKYKSTKISRKLY